jgi:hypothetical protein
MESQDPCPRAIVRAGERLVGAVDLVLHLQRRQPLMRAQQINGPEEERPTDADWTTQAAAKLMATELVIVSGGEVIG